MPYRTAPSIPPATFIERLKRVRGVKPVLGLLTIIAVVATFVFVTVTPGMLALHFFSKPEELAKMKTLDKGMTSFIITVGFAFACYMSYKILHGLHAMSTDVGKSLLEWVELWQKRDK